MKIMEQLAERYPQLYVAPSDHAEEAYAKAVRQGEALEERSLAHFIGSEKDWLKKEETPAGEVEILHLEERADFETFLRIILNRAKPVSILPSVGAQTIIGLRNWKKIADHKEEFLSSGGTEETWWDELVSFAADKARSTDILIVISTGPYSAVPAATAGMSEERWLRVSQDIRYYHECAHFICRRTAPELVKPLWDEITADMTGLKKAVGNYEPELAAVFLGVDSTGYTGGRLEHYLSDEEKKHPAQWEKNQTYDLLLHMLHHPMMDR